MPTTEDIWLSPTEVARALDVETSTVTRWIRSGKLAAITLPSGRYRVHPSEVDRITAGGAA